LRPVAADAVCASHGLIRFQSNDATTMIAAVTSTIAAPSTPSSNVAPRFKVVVPPSR
jgi:hypothetical protein